VSLDNLSDQMLQACSCLSGTTLPVWPASPDERRTASRRRFFTEYAPADEAVRPAA